MGRCQGGFCGPQVLEILARELGKDPTEIVKNEVGSYILTGSTKCSEDEGRPAVADPLVEEKAAFHG
jgi:glycerol-3-phosphate dehydrogenase